jgi:hypothetical protein
MTPKKSSTDNTIYLCTSKKQTGKKRRFIHTGQGLGIVYASASLSLLITIDNTTLLTT